MPTDDARGVTLGSALRAAREDAGLTVEKVAAETRIRATLIRDLESDKFSSSMGSVYARGHIKSIAASLHLDPAPLLALFDKAEGNPAVELAGPEPVQSFGGTEFGLSAAAALRPERTGPRWGIALAGAAVVLVGLVLIGNLSGGSSPKPSALPSTPTSTATVPAVTAPSAQPTTLTASKPPVTGAQLRVRVIGGASWVSISNSTATLFEGILHDGEFKDFHDATRLKVVIGYAPAVNLNCGGHDSGPVATNAKRVKTFACTATGLTSL